MRFHWQTLTAGAGLVAALLGPASGCSTLASHDEARLYRTIRTSQDDHARLLAEADYVARYPGGAWIDVVQSNRTASEEQTWAASNASSDGLSFYLQAYPDGQYVEQARARQAALQTVTTGREEVEQHQEELHQQRAQDAAVERRQWVTRAAQFWVRTLFGIRNIGSPISQVARANPEFSRAFGAAPAPQCTPARCLKHYHAHYAIPVPGGNRLEREMHVVLRVMLDAGRVERIEVLFPNHGFSRWYELENRASVLDEDPEARLAAIEWAMQRIEPILNEVGAGARAIDLIPDPIAALGEAAPVESSDTDTAVSVDGSPEPAPETPATGGGSSTPAVDPSLEALMAGAAGGSVEQTESTETQVESTESEQSFVLPMGLRAVQRGNVRFVVFAAGDGDLGAAFDGFYLERARD